MHLEVKLAREDKPRNEVMRDVDVTIRPRTCVILGHLLQAYGDPDPTTGERPRLVNRLRVYESDIPQLEAMVEDRLDELNRCQQVHDRKVTEWVEAGGRDPRTQQYHRDPLDYPYTMLGLFYDSMGRGVKPIIEMQVHPEQHAAPEEKPAPVADPINQIAALVAERIAGGHRAADEGKSRKGR